MSLSEADSSTNIGHSDSHVPKTMDALPGQQLTHLNTCDIWSNSDEEEPKVILNLTTAPMDRSDIGHSKVHVLSSTELTEGDLRKIFGPEHKVIESNDELLQSKMLVTTSELPDSQNNQLEALTSNLSISTERNYGASSRNADIISVNETERTDNLSLDINLEKQIALEQISSIPTRSRGRKKGVTYKKSPKSVEIISNIITEWGDSEVNKDHTIKKLRSVSEKKFKEMQKGSPKPPFKSSRIIKKKIIWDPDAPETKISYASLVSKPSIKAQTVTENKNANTVRPKRTQKEEIMSLTAPFKRTATVNKSKRAINPCRTGNRVIKNSDKQEECGKSLILNKKIFEITTLKEGTGGKKRSLNSDNTSWDFVYNQGNEDSLIIRRRSNSSYSSTTSPRRLSVEHTPVVNSKKSKTANKCAPENSFEFARPNSRTNTKLGRADETKNKTVSNAPEFSRQSTRLSMQYNEHATEKQNNSKSPITAFKSNIVSITKLQNVTHITIKSKSEKIKGSFNSKLMDEIVGHLEQLETEDSCHVICLSSSGQNFCQGVDFSNVLAAASTEKRKIVNELAGSVKNFLQCLARYPKPLIVGVNGVCNGIGLTILPLFDIVVASEKCTFETPHGRLGQIPEGHCILCLTNSLKHNFKAKLLLLGEKLNSTEAHLAGLVTKIVPASKLHEQMLQHAQQVASLSQQSLLAIKQQKQKFFLEKLMVALSEENKLLIQHWLSLECENRQKDYIKNELK